MAKESAQTLVEKTEKFIADKIQEIKSKNPNLRKSNWFAEIYDLELDYGVDDSILNQNFGLFPHEVNNSVQCTLYAAYQYFMAEKLGFKPRFFLGYGIRQANGSLNKEDKSLVDHAFVDVELDDKKRYLVDRLLGVSGIVTYDTQEKEIKIDKRNGNINTKRTYDELIELKRDGLVDLLMRARTPSGGVEAISSYLRTVKRFRATGYDSCYVFKFLPEENVLRSYFEYNFQLLANNAFFQDLFFNPETGDVEDSILKIGLYSQRKYDQYENYVEFYSESQKFIDPFNELLKRLFLLKTKKLTSVIQKPFMKNLEDLALMGLDSFDLSKILESYPSIIDEKLQSQIRILEDRIEDQFPQRIENAQFERALLLQTLYQNERKMNGGDFLFPLNVRDEPLLNILDEAHGLLLEVAEYQMKILLKYGAKVINSRNVTRGQGNLNERSCFEKFEEFKNLGAFRKVPSFRPEYDYVTDCYQFGKSKVELTSDELRAEISLKGLSVEEAYKRQVFQKLMLPFQTRALMRENSFITNLKSMIKKHYLQK